jgi:hypothetical protein
MKNTTSCLFSFRKIIIVLLACLICPAVYSKSFNFDEEFSLAPDRSLPLKQLIPGTENYFYYHCLHFQNLGNFKKVEDLLKQWIKKYSYSSKVEEIRTRQALLAYKNSPQKSINFLKNKLGLYFNHQKKQLKKKITYPTKLDNNLISFTALKLRAFAYYNDLSGFEDIALDHLLLEPLNNDRRRNLLSRLKRPEGKNLVDLIIADLDHKYSGGFGSLTIHKKLLLSQLEELRDKRPSLINKTDYVETYFKRLHPNEDENWRYNIVQKEAFLNRMQKFAAQLPPAFNSLKANILYHILKLNQQQNKFDKETFMKYIQLPRNSAYVNRKYQRRYENRRNRINLNANYSFFTLLPPIKNEEELIKNQLEHFFLQENSFKSFEEFLDQRYLKQFFARTMILNGIGDLQNWYSMLSPGQVQQLKEEVALQFLPTCKTRLKNNEVVSIDLKIKNIKHLIVKVYQLNVFNYYRINQKEISTDLDLDGLVANYEQKINYQNPDYIAHNETLSFPQIKEKGVYVIEVIGNGKSSRALVRKGQLLYQTRDSAAGQIFTIFNENRQQIKDAKIWLSGTEYKADSNGFITIPYSTAPGTKKLIIRQNGFASLHNFVHKSENYKLQAGFYIDRESIIEGKKAKLILRPNLSLNNNRVSIKLLKNPVLTITSTDLDSVSTTKQIKDLKLENNKEFVYEFKTPEKLINLSFSLTGKVENLSQGKQLDLSAATAFTLNKIDKTDKIECFHIRKVQDSYLAELLGKTGEPRPNIPINIELKHRYFKRTVNLSLKTNALGRVDMGKLKDIDWVKLNSPNQGQKQFSLIRAKGKFNKIITRQAGKTILIPFFDQPDQMKFDVFSLYGIRNNEYVKDLRSKANLTEGYIEIAPLPAGDYELFIKSRQQAIKIKVIEGNRISQLLVSEKRCLDMTFPKPIQIGKSYKKEKDIAIKILNSTPTTRVHVIRTKYYPAFSIFAELGQFSVHEPSSFDIVPPINKYLSGRKIGDEYRYILERKDAKIFPGNMLKRPGLLLNPWSIRKTDTGTQKAQKGDQWRGSREKLGRKDEADDFYGGEPSEMQTNQDYANLNFLPEGSLVATNLIPDKNNEVSIPIKSLQKGQMLHILAIDRRFNSFKTHSFPETNERYLDIRMRKSLEQTKHFSEQKTISLLQKNKSLTLQDASTSKIEVFDNLSAVYSLFSTLSNNQNLKEFGFILRWNKMSDQEKQKLYSKYACHELSFFIYKKDKDFYTKVIKPYLINKRDKTFLDNWLINADLSNYTQPWKFSRLNIVEKILLAKRLPEVQPDIKRHINELFDLIPPDIQNDNFLFNTALKGSSMETDDILGLDAVKDQPHRLPQAPPPMSSVRRPRKLRSSNMEFASKPKVRRAAAKMKRRSLKRAKRDKKLMLSKESSIEAFGDFDEELEADLSRRNEVRQLFRQLEKTEEWVENNYYKLPIENQTGDLVSVNAFWNDYANHTNSKLFYSKHFAKATGNFTEMMFALSVLDLPFEATKLQTSFEGLKMSLKATSPAIVFHKEIKIAKTSNKKNEILTGQNFFIKNDRYKYVKNERFDKFITDEFLTWKAYGCQVILTNPTSARKKVDVLLQIPQGAIPVQNGFYTKSKHIQLEPFSTQKLEYYFYFPFEGIFKHYPVHVSENEEMIATTEPFDFKVVAELSKLDKESWPYISQHGTEQEVITYLKNNNIERLSLEEIAFRMKNKSFFKQITSLLNKRKVFNSTLWSYGLYHSHENTIKQYLPHTHIADQCGTTLSSQLLTVNPIERFTYQHKEYWPLVNARIYPLGQKRKILNQQFSNQYTSLLSNLKYHKSLNSYDLISIAYYMLLQDRIDEAHEFFSKINDPKVKESIQYQYMTAYFMFSLEKPAEAVKIAKAFADYPVIRWKNLFLDIIEQDKEIRGEKSKITDLENRNQQQNSLAQSQPEFEFAIQNEKIELHYQNITTIEINYYLMDIELLFSRQPFVKEIAGQFAVIKPNQKQKVELNPAIDKIDIPIPAEFINKNVMVEISAAGKVKTQTYYPHSLRVSLMEQYGILKVTNKKNSTPISKVYIKVYGRQKDGQIVFFKDGYTDLRGKFDYASLSTNQLDSIKKLSVLIMSENNGAMIKEVNPPAR